MVCRCPPEAHMSDSARKFREEMIGLWSLNPVRDVTPDGIDGVVTAGGGLWGCGFRVSICVWQVETSLCLLITM